MSTSETIQLVDVPLLDSSRSITSQSVNRKRFLGISLGSPYAVGFAITFAIIVLLIIITIIVWVLESRKTNILGINDIVGNSRFVYPVFFIVLGGLILGAGAFASLAGAANDNYRIRIGEPLSKY